MKNLMQKQLLFLAVLLTATIGLQAQHETLFNQARVVGAFGGPITEYGLSNNLSTSVGGGGALVINSFFIGGYGLASVDFDQLYEDGEVDVLDIGHGGFWLGGTYQPHRLVHMYGSARLGWGAINIDLNGNTPYRELDKIFVATPEIGMELNITRWFRLAGTVGYRYVTGVNEDRGLKGEDFSGAVAGVTLRFGWFGRRRSNNW
ncbi:MAG: hypothetical protein ACRBG0_16875 [Lewinella sp.]|jgi:hypothetical protein|uniref:hypothetical protein n=1 Tax=Lewinella TaxID=70994 RepID=UPI000360D5DA|nr:hypothetical protein [Lewinella cohaerens]